MSLGVSISQLTVGSWVSCPRRGAMHRLTTARCQAGGAEEEDDLTQQLRGEIQKDTSQRLANVKSLREQIHQLTLEDAKPARPPGFDRDNAEASQQLAAALEEVKAAERSFQSAQGEQAQWRAESQKDAERLQSATAGVIAGAAGALAAVPFIFADPEPLLENKLLLLASYAVSCGLFGIVLRYAVRDSWDNGQLKQGAIAAFAIAKAAAAAQPVLNASSSLALTDAALWATLSSCLLRDGITLTAATIALQLAVQRQLLRPSSGPP